MGFASLQKDVKVRVPVYFFLVSLLLPFSLFAANELDREFKLLAQEASMEKRLAVKNKLEQRLFYIENRGEVHRVFVEGRPPSTDRHSVEQVFSVFQKAIKNYSELVDDIDFPDGEQACHSYFNTDHKAIRRIESLTKEILLNQKNLGFQRKVGFFWNRSLKQEAIDQQISVEVTRAVLQFELLYRAINRLSLLFLKDQERFLFGRPEKCILEGRREIKIALLDRARKLEALKLLLIGKRGVWDVTVLTNQIGFTEDYIKANRRSKNIKYFSAGFYAVSGLVVLLGSGFVATPAVLAPLLSGLIKHIGIANFIHSAFYAADFGIDLYESLGQIGANSISEEESTKIIEQVEEYLHPFPDNALELAMMAYDYEIMLHQVHVKRTPEALTSGWYKDEKRKYEARFPPPKKLESEDIEPYNKRRGIYRRHMNDTLVAKYKERLAYIQTLIDES